MREQPARERAARAAHHKRMEDTWDSDYESSSDDDDYHSWMDQIDPNGAIQLIRGLDRWRWYSTIGEGLLGLDSYRDGLILVQWGRKGFRLETDPQLRWIY
jgi:hypothetical protein